MKEAKEATKLEELKAVELTDDVEWARNPKTTVAQLGPQLNAYRLQDPLVPLSSHMPRKADKVRELALAIGRRRMRGMVGGAANE
jgi:hypothetical protein